MSSDFAIFQTPGHPVYINVLFLGNVYSPLPGCKQFEHVAGAAGTPLLPTHDCPPTTLFNVKTCVCDYEDQVPCSKPGPSCKRNGKLHIYSFNLCLD